MNYIKLFFNILEFFAFILPAIPDSLIIRLLILLIYFICHYYKLQNIYSKYKSKYLNKDIVNI